MPSIREVTILIVEDDPGHARLIEKTLQRSGITNQLVVLPDGRKAIEYLFDETRDERALLMILDLSLPELDGYQVLERMRRHEQTQHIPVIIMSAVEQPDEIGRAYDLGCNGFVTKPLRCDDFVEAVNKIGQFVSVLEVPEGQSVVAHVS